jgi:hypothetical protein
VATCAAIVGVRTEVDATAIAPSETGAALLVGANPRAARVRGVEARSRKFGFAISTPARKSPARGSGLGSLGLFTVERQPKPTALRHHKSGVCDCLLKCVTLVAKARPLRRRKRRSERSKTARRATDPKHSGSARCAVWLGACSSREATDWPIATSVAGHSVTAGRKTYSSASRACHSAQSLLQFACRITARHPAGCWSTALLAILRIEQCRVNQTDGQASVAI